jgi:hypothetical protein
MREEFISDREVEAYERRTDPARRAVVWSFVAVAAAFVLIGGAYMFGLIGGTDALGNFGGLTASLFGGSEESGETFPLWSAGRDPSASFVKNADTDPVASGSGCEFESGPSAGSGQVGTVLISEVAWMGTEEGAQYEWVELADAGEAAANIGGWSVVDRDEQIQFVFRIGTTIPAGGFFLLARSTDVVGSMRADARYTGNLKNEDEALRLFNEKCEVMDEVLAVPKWPAGETGERRTMERDLATRVWHTSTKVGGTPRAANSAGWSNIFDHPVAPSTPTSTAPPTSLATTSTLVATPVTSASSQGTVVISEVMAGKEGATHWDFVELYNAGPSVANLTGWRLTKKTSTGNESTLVAAARLNGVVIPAGGYFLLAYPDYAGPPPADVVWPSSSSYRLAYKDNAVVLYNADGAKAGEVLWSEIPAGQSYAKIGDSFVVGSPTPRAAPQ